MKRFITLFFNFYYIHTFILDKENGKIKILQDWPQKNQTFTFKTSRDLTPGKLIFHKDTTMNITNFLVQLNNNWILKKIGLLLPKTLVLANSNSVFKTLYKPWFEAHPMVILREINGTQSEKVRCM